MCCTASLTYFKMLRVEEDRRSCSTTPPQAVNIASKRQKPDTALVAYAASLGTNESGSRDDLGTQFAETVTIRCE